MRTFIWFLGIILASTSFADSAQTTFTVDWTSPSSAAQVSPLHFGHNSMWVRGGLGLWNDLTESYEEAMVSRVRAIHPGVLRFPGGTRGMRWRFDQTIGDFKNRIPQCDTFSAKYDATSYGLDEFLRLAESLHSEVSLVSPWAIGSPQQAAAMVAYVNGLESQDVTIGKDEEGTDWKDVNYWAHLRAVNGHPAPYEVKFIEIGNEQYFSIPVGLKNSCDWKFPYKQNFRVVNGKVIPTTAIDHAQQVLLTARLIRKVDPMIQIGAVAHSHYDGSDDVRTFRSPLDRKLHNQDPWNVRLTEIAGSSFDFYVIHPHRFGLGNHALTFTDNVRPIIRGLRRLDSTKQVAITEFGFWLQGDTIKNAIYTADMTRLAIEENLLMSLRHSLIEDGNSPFFGASGCFDGPEATKTPGCFAMDFMANHLSERVLPYKKSTGEDLTFLPTTDKSQTTLGMLIVDRRAKPKGLSYLQINLPEGRWTGTLNSISGPALKSKAKDATVDSTLLQGEKSLTITLPPHAVATIYLTQDRP